MKRRQKASKQCELTDDADYEYFRDRLSQVAASKDYSLLRDNYYVEKGLWDRLYKHQKFAVNWLCNLHKEGGLEGVESRRMFKGCIISDEMGLGKTVQILSFFSALHSTFYMREQFLETSKVHNFLLVCPATLMNQWLVESRVWFPRLRVVIIHSISSENKTTDNKVSFLRSKNAVKYDFNLFITSYRTFQIYREQFCSFCKYYYVILDEGHLIKNPEGDLRAALNKVESSFRIVLTGTPIQNNLKELWSLVDFVCPGLLGNLRLFSEQFAVPIAMGSYSNCNQLHLRTSIKKAKTLQCIVEPYILRRTKKQVDLTQFIKSTDKTEQILYCKMTEPQTDLYKKHLIESYRELQDFDKHSDSVSLLFTAMLDMKNIANHTFLYSKNEQNSKFDIEYEALMAHSGKLNVLVQLLKNWKKTKNKVLIFTQRKKMLDIFEVVLNELDIVFYRMDGTVGINRRYELIQSFSHNEESNECKAFILTSKVGGVGLNLCAADRVVIYDPDWNPSTDQQSQERVWRIGQLNESVRIYRLISAGTIEQYVYNKQIFKDNISKRILENPTKNKNFIKYFNFKDIFTSNTSEVINDAKDIFEVVDHENSFLLGYKNVNFEHDETNHQSESYNEVLDLILTNKSIDSKNLQTTTESIEAESDRRVAEALSKLKEYQDAEHPPKNTPKGKLLLIRLKRQMNLTKANDENLAVSLIEFLKQHNNQASNKELVSNFEQIANTPLKMTVLKKILQQITSFDKHSNKWVLKKAFH